MYPCIQIKYFSSLIHLIHRLHTRPDHGKSTRAFTFISYLQLSFPGKNKKIETLLVRKIDLGSEEVRTVVINARILALNI